MKYNHSDLRTKLLLTKQQDVYIYIYTKEKRRANEVEVSKECMCEKKEREKEMKNEYRLFINEMNIHERMLENL